MKKLLIMFICLLSSLSVAYMYHNSSITSFLNAQSAPAFTLPKGAKIVLGKYNNKEVVWDIGNNNNNGSYVLMSSMPIVNEIAKYNPSIGCFLTEPTGSNKSDAAWICPNTMLDNEVSKIVKAANEINLLSRDFFIPNYQEVKNGGELGLNITDRACACDGAVPMYFLNDRGISSVGWETVWRSDIATLIQGCAGSNSTVEGVASEDVIWGEPDYIFNKITGAPVGYGIFKTALRPYATMYKDKIHFAANIAYTDGAWHSYTVD